MEKTKPWYFSKTIWASLIAVIGSMAAAFGFEIGADEQEQFSEAIVQIVTVTASLLAVLGRLSATSRID